MQGFSRFSCLRTISIFVAEEMSGKTKFHTPARAIAYPSHLPVQMRLSKPLACPNALYVPIRSTNAWPVQKQFKQLAQTACLSKLYVQTLGLSEG